MSKADSHNFDLLHKRWDVNGESAQKYISTKKLRERGALIGISFTLFCFLVCLSTLIYSNYLSKKKDKLLIQANKFDQLDKKYRENLSSLRKVVDENREIAQGIAGIRSGSALLSELREILPNTIQVKMISADNNKLNLQGLAIQPYGLDSINSLKIQIENSIFINKKNVKLTRAWETEKDNIENKNEKTKVLKYKIIANFSDKYNSKLISYLRKLGSYGLASRVQKIKREGLLK